jgi:aminoglycoside phosphotransferase (APT) family kinase protein
VRYVRKMHADEVPTDVGLVRRLIASQFPQWSALPVHELVASGTVHALYRLGEEMVVRLPRRSAEDVEAEHTTLRRLRGRVPVEIPEPRAVGAPGEGYPWEWCIDNWLVGEHPVAGEISDELAREIADVVLSLRVVETNGVPPSGRGSSLRRFDAAVRGTLPKLDGVIDTAKALALWEEALALPEWSNAPVWVHEDLMPANLLVRKCHLTGILDWGSAGAGDPAIDLQPAWNMLDARTRPIFRAALSPDDAMWMRGRAWALWTGIMALPYYRETNPVLAQNASYRLGQVLGAI